MNLISGCMGSGFDLSLLLLVFFVVVLCNVLLTKKEILVGCRSLLLGFTYIVLCNVLPAKIEKKCWLMLGIP